MTYGVVNARQHNGRGWFGRMVLAAARLGQDPTEETGCSRNNEPQRCTKLKRAPWKITQSA
jgi:hypothetical protein